MRNINFFKKSVNSIAQNTKVAILVKQPPRGVLKKRCSKNIQQVYWRIPMPKYQIALRYGYSPVNLLHIFRTPFPRNISGWLFLNSFENIIHNSSLQIRFFS